MLELHNLRYTVEQDGAAADILKDVSLTIEDKRFIVITGPNGGGKTTLAKAIMGIVTPNEGRIVLDGEDITGLSISERAKRGISYGFQQPPRFKGMKVEDLLCIAAGKKLSHDEACAYLTKVGLCARDYLERDVDTSLSGGEVKRIEIATVLARHSKLMIFDEPEAGIDLWSFARLTDTFREIHDKKEATIIIISHQERIIRLADEIIMIGAGQILDRGPVDRIYPKIIAETVSGWDMTKIPGGAVNIRSDGQKEYRSNSENIEIVSKTDKDGIDIKIKPHTVGESVYIPVILTKSGFQDMVYNDFFVGEGSDVTIVAGCGIHNCGGCGDSQHDGIHTFYVGKNAKVKYIEKHYGEGDGQGKRILNPQTILYLEEGAHVTLETSQIRGVDDTKRYTRAELQGEGSEIVITEKLLTHGDQHAVSEMDVLLNAPGSKTQVISRSVAQDNSNQVFYPRVTGNCDCFGHVQCDAIIMGQSKVRAIPEITCNHVDASLIHEAAIGKIAGEQILKLMTLGLSHEEAEQKILDGFLR